MWNVSFLVVLVNSNSQLCLLVELSKCISVSTNKDNRFWKGLWNCKSEAKRIIFIGQNYNVHLCNKMWIIMKQVYWTSSETDIYSPGTHFTQWLSYLIDLRCWHKSFHRRCEMKRWSLYEVGQMLSSVLGGLPTQILYK